MEAQPNARTGHRLRRRWAGGERGAVLVEFALLVPVLALCTFALIEYGFVFKDTLVISAAARSGARTGVASVNGDNSAIGFADSDSDVQILRAVNAAIGRLRGQVQYVVVFRSTDAAGTVPATCKAGTAVTNTAGAAGCNVYDPIDMVRTDDWSAAATRGTDPTYAKSRFWLPDTRNIRENPPPDYLGVYIRTTHHFITSYVDFESNSDKQSSLGDGAVLRLGAKASNSNSNVAPVTQPPILPTPPTLPTTSTSRPTTTSRPTSSTAPTTTTTRPPSTTLCVIGCPATTTTRATSTTATTQPPSTTTTRPTTSTVPRTTTTRPLG